MPAFEHNHWLHRFCWLTATATLALIVVGGLVTSHGAGMAVPDWPNSYGYNMFLFPPAKWVGGILFEHSHRLIATVVGVLVVAQTRWLAGKNSRLPLFLIGAAECICGIALVKLAPDWKGAGHFLSGIGGVVLLASAVWVRNEPAQRPLPALAWSAFFLVQIQGLLGGLRVVLYHDEIGIFHATFAQLFFVLVCATVLLSSRWWKKTDDSPGPRVCDPQQAQTSKVARLILFSTVLIFLQLILGATMRHQHAGLAIPDFPLAYGSAWPATDSASVQLYNQQRMEVTGLHPITAAQIGLQMSHRILAALILASVGFCAWAARRDRSSKFVFGWTMLIIVQALLGAATIWSNKAADIATGHVLLGALSLAFGSLLSIIALRNLTSVRRLERGAVTRTASAAGQACGPLTAATAARAGSS